MFGRGSKPIRTAFFPFNSTTTIGVTNPLLCWTLEIPSFRATFSVVALVASFCYQTTVWLVTLPVGLLGVTLVYPAWVRASALLLA